MKTESLGYLNKMEMDLLRAVIVAIFRRGPGSKNDLYLLLKDIRLAWERLADGVRGDVDRCKRLLANEHLQEDYSEFMRNIREAKFTIPSLLPDFDNQHRGNRMWYPPQPYDAVYQRILDQIRASEVTRWEKPLAAIFGVILEYRYAQEEK
jgi:hypothetical protein